MNIYLIPLNLEGGKGAGHLDYIKRLPEIAKVFCSMPWAKSRSRYLDYLILRSEEQNDASQEN